MSLVLATPRTGRLGRSFTASLAATLVAAVVLVTGPATPAGATVAQPALLTLAAGLGGTSPGYSTGENNVATRALFGETLAIGDGDGNLYVSEYSTCRIRKVDTAGLVSNIAGTGTCGYTANGAAAASSAINQPLGLAFDGSGNLYFAESGNCLVRKIAASDGVLSTVAGRAPVNGVPQCGFSETGYATYQLLNAPYGVAVNAAGHVFIADGNNCRIRRVNGLTMTTAAGSATCGDSVGTSATTAQLGNVTGLVIDPAGNLYFADAGASRVRKLTFVWGGTNTVTNVAGTGVAGYSGNGIAPLSSQLNHPSGVALTAGGSLVIADKDNCQARVIYLNGLYTSAGGTCGNSGNRVPATTAQLGQIGGVAITPNGDLVISDSSNFQVKVVNRAFNTQAQPGGSSTAVVGYQHTGLTNDWRAYGNSRANGEWTGGDGVFSLPINGKVVWIFGDSYVGTSNASAVGYVRDGHDVNPAAGGNPSTGFFVHNQFVVENPSATPTATFDSQINASAPASFFAVANHESSLEGVWPLSPYVQSNAGAGTVGAFMYRWQVVGGVPVIQDVLFSSVPLSTMAPTAPATIASVAWPTITDAQSGCENKVLFGNAVVPDGSGGLYVYGTESCQSPAAVYVHVAHMIGSTDPTTATWEYFNGIGAGQQEVWESAPKVAGRLQQFGSDGTTLEAINNGWYEMSVAPHGSTYRMVHTTAVNSLNLSDWSGVSRRRLRRSWGRSAPRRSTRIPTPGSPRTTSPAAS